MGFISVLLTIFIVIYFLGIILKFLFKWWITRKMSQFGGAQGAGRSSRGEPGQSNKSKEGEVHVSQSTEDTHKVDKKLGEYVDYEEIKD